MNRASLEYKSYLLVLEGVITHEQRTAILAEAGSFDLLGKLGLKGGKFSNFLKKFLGKNPEAAGDYKEVIDALKKLKASFGNDENALYGALNQIFSGAEIKLDTAKIANPPKPPSNAGTDGSSAGANSPASGTPLAQAPDQAAQAFAGAAAEIDGRSEDGVEKAKEEVVDKGVGVEKALDVIGGILAKVTKVPAATDIVKFLFKNKKIQFEGRGISVDDLPIVERRLFADFKEMLVMERWNRLANLIVEAEPASGNATSDDQIPPEAKKFEDLIDQLVGRFKGVKKKQIADVLKALDDTKGLKVVGK